MGGNLFDSPAAGQPGSAGWFTAHCDGGSRGNPGPAGFGAVIEDPQGHVAARLSAFLGMQTNNYAEYSGLLAVLKWAGEHGVRWLRVVSDSELMVKQMNGKYKVASPGLRPLWEEARRLVRNVERFEMVHTLRAGNKEADRLANEAMDRGMGKTPGGGSGPGAGVPTSPIAGQGGRPATKSPATQFGAPSPVKPRQERQVLDGYVKNGVVHLLEGELPEGIFVKVIREQNQG